MNADFDEVSAAYLIRRLIHSARDAALGTLDAQGRPFVSHVAVATLCDGAPLVLNSDLALHTQNLKRDSRASLLFVAEAGDSDDTNTRARTSLAGTMTTAPDRAMARSRFVRRHPGAAAYVDFGDMHLMRFEPERAHLVAGFGRIKTLSAPAVLIPDVDGLEVTDEGACIHMNEDHPDAMTLIATRLCGAPEGEWRAVGVDALGLDLACGETGVRAEYDTPLTNAGALRVALKRLTDAARASGGQMGAST